MNAGDPVSWLMIEPHWHVVGSDGNDIGHVELFGEDAACVCPSRLAAGCRQ